MPQKNLVTIVLDQVRKCVNRERDQVVGFCPGLLQGILEYGEFDQSSTLEVVGKSNSRYRVNYEDKKTSN